MTPYYNLNGDSGIVAYGFTDDGIKIMFRSSAKIYEYSSSLIGAHNVEEMRRLAKAGRGLNTFINMNPIVKKGYKR